ncbi:MAG: hypothetical protein WDM70_11725 [Nitrosomonadales bacterium]
MNSVRDIEHRAHKWLYLALAGVLLAGIGLAEILAETNIIPHQFQFNNYGRVMVGLGWLLTVPFTLIFYQAARAKSKEKSLTVQKKPFENNGHAANTNFSSGNKKFDFVEISYTLATCLTILFWILIYRLNVLTDLFPSYKGENLMLPTFIFPVVILTLSGGIAVVFDSIISKVENDRYPKKLSSLGCPLNDLLYQYTLQKAYWKLLLVVICWLSMVVMRMALATTYFGVFIAIKYSI